MDLLDVERHVRIRVMASAAQSCRPLLAEESVRVITLFLVGMAIGIIAAIAIPDTFVDSGRFVTDTFSTPNRTSYDLPCCTRDGSPIVSRPLLADYRGN